MFAIVGIPFVTQVYILYIGCFQTGVTHYVTAEVEVVVNGSGKFAKFRTIHGFAVSQAELLLLVQLVCGIQRGEEVVIIVESTAFALLVLPGIHDEFLAVVLITYSGI